MLSQLEDENAIEVCLREITWKCLPGSWGVSDVFKNAGAAGEDKNLGKHRPQFYEKSMTYFLLKIKVSPAGLGPPQCTRPKKNQKEKFPVGERGTETEYEALNTNKL